MSSWEALNGRETAVIDARPDLPDRPAPPVLTAITTAARGGVLWLAVAAVEAVRPGGDRRLAAESAIAVVVAIGLGHAVKRLAPHRPRPQPPGGRSRVTLPETPKSSAFPSTHAASAAAFATAVLLRDRRLATVVTPVAAAATYARVRTRVHWPTDLAAGTALGAGAAILTHRACTGFLRS